MSPTRPTSPGSDALLPVDVPLPQAPPQGTARASGFGWPQLLLAALLAVIAALVSGCGGAGGPPGPDPTAAVERLRDVAERVAPGAWHDEMDVRVGGPAFTLARLGAGLADVDPRVREVLAAARSATARTAHRTGQRAARPDEAARLLTETASSLATLGWRRVAAVMDGRQVVCVFVGGDPRPDEELSCSVLFQDAGEMVVVGMRIAPAPLERLASEFAKGVERGAGSGERRVRGKG